MKTLQRAWLPIAAGTAMYLAACGGGGAPAAETSATDTPIEAQTPEPVGFVAFGTSADTVSLGWKRTGGSATFAIERKSAGGDWEAVASVAGRTGKYLDTGLSAVTDYSYRLVEVGATRVTLAQSSTKTSDEQPVTTPAGSALADALTKTLGSTGGQVVSPDGAIVVDVPAGAFAANANAAIQPLTNTAPDGRGDGLKVRFDPTPAAPLKLTLRYAAAHDAEADAQRIAVQRADGSWISLPLLAIDKTARTLTAELPPSLFAASAGAGTASRTARAMAAVPAGGWTEFTVVRYLAFHLDPKQARVATKKSRHLMPYARVRGLLESCSPEPFGAPLCVAELVMTTREIQFLNSKAGFDRRWTVSGLEGGTATLGTVIPSGSVGATFKAPASVPDPSTVTVTFESRDLETGRTVKMSSQIEITPDHWVGTMTAETGASDAGTTLTAMATATWEIDETASTDTRKIYRASGRVDVVVADDDCSVSVAPSSQPVSTQPQLVELTIDEGRSPMTYTARLITFWPATLSAVCPKASAATPTLAGYGWDVSGLVSDDGNRIEGRSTVDGAALEWSFTR